MDSNVAACDECSRTCMMIHHNRDPSRIVASFFKVMYGKHFSGMLIIPPRFVKFSSLIAQETYLEDSSGQKWNVFLSNVNGSLAFQKGWHEFTVDHGIEVGDFAVFHYITKSHFVVQIYGRNGCEKLRFSDLNRSRNKRAKRTKDFVVSTAPSDMFSEEPPSEDVSFSVVSEEPPPPPSEDATKGKNDPNPSQQNDIEMSEGTPASGFSEDSFFIVNRDTSSTQENDRGHLFDLSTFERLDKKVEKRQLQTNSCPQKGKKHHIAEANTVTYSKDDGHFLKKENSLPFSSSQSNINHKPSVSSIPPMPYGMPQNFGFSAASGRGLTILDQDTKRFSSELCKPLAETSPHASIKEAKLPIPMEAKINITEFSQGSNYMVKEEVEGNTMVKPEPTDICDSPMLDVKVACLVTPDIDSFLDLPEQLPTKMYRQGAKVTQKLVFLRDPARRLWPVVYHENKGFKVLASGWQTFRKANDIKPGDKCNFGVENAVEGIFEVQIIHG